MPAIADSLVVPKSCMTCAKFIGCGDNRRSHTFSCFLYEAKSITVGFGSANTLFQGGDSNYSSDDDDSEDYGQDDGARKKFKSQGPKIIETSADSELQLVSMLEELMNPVNKVPFDLKIDDRDLPEFPNFFEFCMSKDGANQAPFSRQLTAAIHLLSEWCPRCSHPRFKDIRKVPVDFPTASFPDKVQFLHHGVCPKCKVTKAELVLKGELNFYSELAACVGQRAGKSAMIGLIVPYIVHKYLKLQNPTQVLGLMRNSILIGTMTALTYAKSVELLWTPIHNTMTSAKWFCVIEGTPISMADGTTKPIEDVAMGDEVITLEGTNLVTNVFDNGVQDVIELGLANGQSLTATASHQVRVFCTLSNSLVWKTMEELTEGDLVVVE